MAAGLDVVRAFDESRNGGGLAKAQVFGVLSIITACRSLDAVEVFAEENAIQIQFEDIGLRVGALNALCHEGLHELALVAALHEPKGLSCKLLGDGAGSLRDSSGLEVQIHGAHQADVIHAIMLEKAAVLL